MPEAADAAFKADIRRLQKDISERRMWLLPAISESDISDVRLSYAVFHCVGCPLYLIHTIQKQQMEAANLTYTEMLGRRSEILRRNIEHLIRKENKVGLNGQENHFYQHMVKELYQNKQELSTHRNQS